MFKRKKEIIDNWKYVTLEMLVEINKIGKVIEDEDTKSLKVAALLSGKSLKEIEELPISKAMELISQTRFLYTTPQRVKTKKELNLNGKLYYPLKKTEEMTTAQFIDFHTIVKELDVKLIEFMSLFIIPKGHKYGDGYDMEEVYKDVKTMSVVEALDLADFFTKAHRKLLKRTLLFSEARMKAISLIGNKEQRKIAKETHKILMELRKNLNSLIG